MSDRAYVHELRILLAEAEEELSTTSYAEVLEEVADEVRERQDELTDDDGGVT